MVLNFQTAFRVFKTSETRLDKQNKDIQKFSSVYSERGVVVAKNYVKSIKEVCFV